MQATALWENLEEGGGLHDGLFCVSSRIWNMICPNFCLRGNVTVILLSAPVYTCFTLCIYSGPLMHSVHTVIRMHACVNPRVTLLQKEK
jgi:hypothetical protein